jgi:hypothetical protein
MEPAVTPTKDVPRDRELYGITGVQGRPVVSFSFATNTEAEAARTAMLAVVATAQLIMPHIVRLS